MESRPKIRVRLDFCELSSKMLLNISKSYLQPPPYVHAASSSPAAAAAAATVQCVLLEYK